MALNENIHTVCIDETVGRRVARLNDLKVTGTIGVLLRGKKAGLNFSMRQAINKMQASGIYLSQTVIDFSLKHS